MNSYGNLALEHWRRWRPSHLEAISAAEGDRGVHAYFARLGEQMQRRVGELTAHMAASERDGLSSDFLTRAGQMNMIRNDAEQAVLREFLLPGETSASDVAPDEADSDGSDREQDPDFEVWKTDTLVALATGDLSPWDLSSDELERLRRATVTPRLRELARIRDEDLAQEPPER